NDTHEATIPAYSLAEQRKRAEVLLGIRDIEEGLKHQTSAWEKRQAEWEARIRKDELPWQVVKVEHAGDNGQRYVYHDDGSKTAGGYAATKWTSQFVGRPEA